MSGQSIIQASRMIDAPAFKQAIADRGALLGLIVSPFVCESYVGDGDGVLGPEDYVPVPVQVKETRKQAWMYLTGALPAIREPLMHPGAGLGVLAA